MRLILREIDRLLDQTFALRQRRRIEDGIRFSSGSTEREIYSGSFFCIDECDCAGPAQLWRLFGGLNDENRPARNVSVRFLTGLGAISEAERLIVVTDSVLFEVFDRPMMCQLFFQRAYCEYQTTSEATSQTDIPCEPRRSLLRKLMVCGSGVMPAFSNAEAAARHA